MNAHLVRDSGVKESAKKKKWGINEKNIKSEEEHGVSESRERDVTVGKKIYRERGEERSDRRGEH